MTCPRDRRMPIVAKRLASQRNDSMGRATADASSTLSTAPLLIEIVNPGLVVPRMRVTLSATTNPGEVELQTTCDQPAIHATALVDPAGNACAIHLVNTGAARDVAISGLPPGIGHLQTYITDADHSFAPNEMITATDGMVRLSLPALGYVTLTTPK